MENKGFTPLKVYKGEKGIIITIRFISDEGDDIDTSWASAADSLVDIYDESDTKTGTILGLFNIANDRVEFLNTILGEQEIGNYTLKINLKDTDDTQVVILESPCEILS